MGPPGFDASIVIAIDAYKRDGGGSNITSPYLARVFLFATVMYVDDTQIFSNGMNPLKTRMRS